MKKAPASDFKSQNKCLFKVLYSVVSVSGAASVSLSAPAGCVPAALSGSPVRTVSFPARLSGGTVRMAAPD